MKCLFVLFAALQVAGLICSAQQTSQETQGQLQTTLPPQTGVQVTAVPQSTASRATSIALITVTAQPETSASPIQTAEQVTPTSSSLQQRTAVNTPESTTQSPEQSSALTGTTAPQLVVTATQTASATYQLASDTTSPPQTVSLTLPTSSGTTQATSLPQCSADLVKDFKITSPVNFAECPILKGNAQFTDAERTTVWLPPQEGNPVSPSGPAPIPVTFEENSNTTATFLKPSFMTISWILPAGSAFQQPSNILLPDASLPQAQQQRQIQQQSQQQSQSLRESPMFSKLLELCPQAGSILQQQQQQMTTSTPLGTGAPAISQPNSIFNPVSVKLIDSQGAITNGSLQIGWYQAHQKSGGALLAYLQETIPDGVYAFLITGQFQSLKPIAALPFTTFSTMFYQPGPECAFLTHPFRVISSDLSSQKEPTETQAPLTTTVTAAPAQTQASATTQVPATTQPAPGQQQNQSQSQNQTQNVNQ